MPFAPGEVANYAVRVFLERIGRRYDELRGLKRFNDTDVEAIRTVLGFFANSCPYCEGPLTDAGIDHIVPTNMTSVGLHAWGNVVWVCGSCNNGKKARPWREFVRSISSDDEFYRRVARVEAFQRAYQYDTDDALAALAADLHAGVKRLIDEKVTEAEPIISAFRAKVTKSTDA